MGRGKEIRRSMVRGGFIQLTIKVLKERKGEYEESDCQMFDGFNKYVVEQAIILTQQG